jgi:lipopolysaccharide transport system ATP-binding protein
MADVAIKVENLGKCYRLTHQGPRNNTLRDSIMDGVRSIARRLRPGQSAGTPAAMVEDFWALRDISFEVPRGQVLGLIGRNGAGKSTLLKLLSRITDPSTGRIGIRGRVASLLEVGTGFHPELTGRENIYLNGAILGMKRAEIRRKFDEIVAFSEVEKFLDTPVKRFSSGMYVRLAFAVAAHLEPEILVVDEVLAVGDLAFQKKCLGRMSEVAMEHRTVLFVSHNMHAVQHLCQRGILLHQGQVLDDGPVAGVIRRYHEELRSAEVNTRTALSNHRFRRGTGDVRFDGIHVQDETGQERLDFRMYDTIRFQLGYRVMEPVRSLWVQVLLRSGISNEPVTTARHLVSAEPLARGASGTITIEWPAANLRPGNYPLYFWLGDPDTVDYDILDRLVGPLTIGTEDAAEDLGFDPTMHSGYFNVESHLIMNTAQRVPAIASSQVQVS